MNANQIENEEVRSIRQQLHSLELRMSVLEEKLKGSTSVIRDSGKNDPEQDFEINMPFKVKNSIEFGIGEYGMAWLGNIVLLIAIVFFVQSIHSERPVLSVLTGYLAVAGIYLVSFFTQKTYPYLSQLFGYNGHLLLFYLTLRLHFSDNPIIENDIAGLAAVVAVVGILFYFSLKKKSQIFTGVILLLLLIAALLSNTTHFLLTITTITAVAGMWLYQKFGWYKLLFVLMTLVYIVYFLWMLNNPIVTYEAHFRETHGFGFIYLMITGFIFSLPAILPKGENDFNEMLVFLLIWNGLGFTSLFVLSVFLYLNDSYSLLFALIAFLSLAYAVVIHQRKSLKIGASLYAVYGFMAMSVAIYGTFLLPDSYMLFALQSFIVVSAALWFRSQFIVVANTLLFLFLLFFYLKDPVIYRSTDFSFMLVAFLTARIINWKKDRLNLRTETIRNLYLAAGFTMTLVAFHHTVPESMVTVSWIFAAVLFFIMGYLLKNIKYRWLAIAALIASAIHLVLIDMSNMDAGARIIVFLLFAFISIAVSILYTKHLDRRKESEP